MLAHLHGLFQERLQLMQQFQYSFYNQVSTGTAQVNIVQFVELQ